MTESRLSSPLRLYPIVVPAGQCFTDMITVCSADTGRNADMEPSSSVGMPYSPIPNLTNHADAAGTHYTGAVEYVSHYVSVRICFLQLVAARIEIIKLLLCVIIH